MIPTVFVLCCLGLFIKYFPKSRHHKKAVLLKHKLIKKLSTLKEWSVFWVIEIALFITEYWLELLVFIAWTVMWIFLINFSSEYPRH